MRLLAVTAAVLIVAFAAFGSTPLTPEQQESVLNDALGAYDRGIVALADRSPTASSYFDAAAAKFELLIASGVKTPALYYNLGNAHLQRSRLGDAILAYRRAEQLDPSDPRLQENLAYAQSLRIDQIPERAGHAILARLFGWRQIASWQNRFLLTIGLYVACWTMLGAGLWLSRRGLLFGSLAAGALSLIVASSCFYDWWRTHHAIEGVLLHDEIVVRKGNGEGFEPAFQERLHSGTEFDLLEARGDWIHVQFPDGSDGWIRADDAGLVNQPLIRS